MESETTLEHETTLERALDLARANHKEAKRLYDEAVAGLGSGYVGEDRVAQLKGLLEVAAEDVQRVMKEQ
ncbi:hypothetical protein [Arthrobacter cavernae]|uniref:Uncharacterized protein n=1 Tax=Arthrobacter cavernae TaxID=2817681 RepID=A0A939KJK0_9MICC|nr:hypothetical protein [Arthrobacter cavernae]MBO1268767.1 hypothetical protein [Arthrobacter cavernae]